MSVTGVTEVQEWIDVLRPHDVAAAWLFGSRVDGTARENSDHDLAVLLGHTPTLRELGGLQVAVERIVGTKVDIVELDRAPLELRAAVVQRGRLLFSDDEPRRVRFATDTLSRWFDFRPVVEELTAAYLHRVATRGL